MHRLAYSLALLFSLCLTARGVENGDTANGITFNTSDPTSSQVSSWNTGWGTDSTGTEVDGWDYVGQVGDASGVYLGNGWVITAAHVSGVGTFTLNGVTYDATSSPVYLSSGSTPIDLVLFQIGASGGTSLPDLPTLTIATSAPKTGFHASSVVMIGYGGGTKAWGENTVTAKGVNVGVNGFTTVDFETAYSYPSNEASLINGDSGGGDFIYDSTHGVWDLAGLNEAIDDNQDSYLIQLSQYASLINSYVDASATPEPGSLALLVLGLGALMLLGRQALSPQVRSRVRA